MNIHKEVEVIPPRDLTQPERDILERLLSAEFQGREDLKIQIGKVKVSKECTSCASIVFSLEPGNFKKADVQWRIPVEAEGTDKDGIKIHFMLHVVDGVIDELEIIKEDFSNILQLPSPESLEIFTLG